MTEDRCSMTDCGGTAVYEGRCVGHMSQDELADHVAHLGRDTLLDARGAPIDQDQCRRLVDVLAVSEFSGDATFEGAQFSGVADFREAQFSGAVDFRKAQFSSTANFGRARFGGEANFWLARF